MIGKTLSHYKVIEKIGQGGMGEVYRAEDTNLSREVAIKVLPEQFTQDPQRLARFEREAKLLASLNHPNIAAIYGLEEADGVRFLALELVPGETLQERVAKGPLPVEEALEVCRQIAEGVEAAHEKGVIHRDLKPANVKVTPEGKVKILDFGLAKAFEAEPPVTDISQSPTLTEEMTRAGVILGTAAYMSPEQAKGEEVDKRADIFAFGCVLYELLTGKRTFSGKTITETLGAIIHKEPDWEALPRTTPWRIQELLRRCLTKDAHDRLRDIATVRIEVKLALYEPAGELPTGVASAAQPTRQRWSLTVGLVVGAVVAGLAVWLLIQAPSAEQSLSRFVIRPSPPVVLPALNSNEVAISPDGRQLVYMGVGEEGRQLYLRSLDDFVDRPIPGATNPTGIVFFSPDGKSIGFFSDNKLKKTSLAGGPPITLCDAPSGFRSGDWFEDTIVFTATSESGQGLYRVSANGGEPEMLATANSDEGEGPYALPDFLPDGKNLLFTIALVSSYQTALLSLETGEQKVLLENARQARYLSTGHLVYEQSRTGNLMVVPFDLAALEETGDSVPVVQGVRQTSYVDYAVSDEGTLVYVPAGGGLNNALVWVDREGAVEPLDVPPHQYESPRLSPDGQRVALRTGRPDGQIWVYEVTRGTLTRLTFEGRNVAPTWMPDGTRVTFGSGAGSAIGGLFWKPADGSGVAEQLLASGRPGSWSPDGRVLAFTDFSTGDSADADIWLLPIEGERTAQPFLNTPFNEGGPAFSPDGRWLAYVSDESGRYEVYVRPYPGPGSKFPISIEGGVAPVWARDGRELFYRNGDKMMSVTVEAGSEFRAGKPEVVFEERFEAGVSWYRPNYDISPDGQRFVMIKAGEEAPLTQINVVLNWFEELKRLAPTP